MRTEDVLDQIDGALGDWAVGPDAMRMNAPTGAGLMSRPPIRVNLAADASAFAAALRRVNEVISDMAPKFKAAMEAIARALPQQPSPYDEHHPKPLCIDGHAYHQRRRNRRKR